MKLQDLQTKKPIDAIKTKMVKSKASTVSKRPIGLDEDIASAFKFCTQLLSWVIYGIKCRSRQTICEVICFGMQRNYEEYMIALPKS